MTRIAGEKFVFVISVIYFGINRVYLSHSGKRQCY